MYFQGSQLWIMYFLKEIVYIWFTSTIFLTSTYTYHWFCISILLFAKASAQYVEGFLLFRVLRNIALVATKRCVCDRQCTCCQIARKWFVLCWRELKEVKYMVLTYNNSPEWKLHQRSNVMMISYWQCMLNSLLEKNCWLVHLKIFWSILTHIYIIFCGRKFLT